MPSRAVATVAEVVSLAPATSRELAPVILAGVMALQAARRPVPACVTEALVACQGVAGILDAWDRAKEAARISANEGNVATGAEMVPASGWMTAQEAADRLGKTAHRIRQIARAGTFGHRNPDGGWHFDHHDIEEYANNGKPTPPE